ncbi:uncharacterized protein LOC121373129 [Gigantopelta aegis]|uniref:uncharacterized protein LOC121373129 n=1 Tax=Gigantopelta aegis TaxID=1735272 RepID=UPI001B88A434|nr:uncharacterized protein LOC121373129 [Gigantopelta aegis]
MEPHFDDRPFTTKGNIKQDMHTHTDEKTFRCVHCSKCLAATASLKRDTCTCMLVPISPRHLECNECNKCFEHMSDFKKHLETSSDVDEDNAGFVRCKVCSKSFPRSDCLKHLMLIHSDDKTVQCDVCFNFKKHVDTHFDDGPLECTVCNKSFSRRECLKHHMLNHSDDRRFRCEVCSKDFTRSFDLEMHLLIHSGKKPFRCGMCLKKFQSKEGIEQHMLIHTGVKSFKCEECGKCFARSDNLKQHMLSHTFKCEECGKCFARSDNLKQHMLSHTFKCEECGKCFARSDNLKQHMLSHTFKCEECGKCFARRDNLEQHMLCHTAAEKHFKCGVCHKSFSESRGLKTHMLDHTDEQEPKKKRFKTVDELELKSIVLDSKSKSTLKTTTWGVKIFKEWLEFSGGSQEFETLSPDKLNTSLKKFYAEVRNTDGSFYSKSSYVGLRAAIQRHLRQPPRERSINILQDNDFHTANNVFIAMLKKIKQLGLANPTHHEAISKEDLLKIRKQQSVDDPTKLQQKVWFDLTLGFGRRVCENQRQLSRGSFAINIDDVGCEYIAMTHREATKNHPGGIGDTDKSKTFIYATGTPSCPVFSFRKYVSKLNPQNNTFFQQPRKQATERDKLWYTTKALGHNALTTMMKRISKDCRLSKEYTNQCVRSTAVTLLSHAGVEAREIVKITGHKNEQSLSSCKTESSTAQKRHYSAILQNDAPNVPAPDSSSVSKSTNFYSPDQKYVRPGRPCPFCDFFSQNSKLSRHISLKHGDILEVKNALQMPRTARLQAFDHFKKRSIFLTNKMLLANSNNEILMTEKKSGSSQTVVCQRCKGFYAKRSFYKHKKRCRSKAIVDNTAVESGPVPVEMLASCEEDEDFTVNVLSKFYQDPVGNVCKSNSMIKKIGLHLWQKSKKDREKRSLVRKSVTRDMRILELLFLEFRKQTTHGEGEDATFSDMFKREYLDYLKQAIESLIYSKPNGGLVKSALMYLINTAGQIIQADFFIQNMDEEASEVDKFLKIYHCAGATNSGMAVSVGGDKWKGSECRGRHMEERWVPGVTNGRAVGVEGIISETTTGYPIANLFFFFSFFFDVLGCPYINIHSFDDANSFNFVITGVFIMVTKDEYLKGILSRDYGGRCLHREVNSERFTSRSPPELSAPADKKAFQCGMCMKLFSAKSHIKRHMVVHSGEKPFECVVCLKCFALSSNLKQHILIHNVDNYLKCDAPTACFTPRQFVENGEKSYECVLSATSGIQKPQQLVENGEKLFDSDASTNTCSSNRQPQVRENSEKSFECDMSSTSFTEKSQRLMENGEKLFKCNVTTTSTCSSSQAQPQFVSTDKKLFECKVLSTKGPKHKTNLTEYLVPQMTIKRFQCGECLKTFTHNSSLKEHMNLHTGKKPHECKICLKSFNQSVSLRHHMLFVHTGNSRPFRCGLCGQSFMVSSKLNQHMLLHSPDNPYKCAVCGRYFSFDHQFKNHILIHTSEKPYTCEVCAKVFNRSEYLKQHMLVHTGEKPYKCDLCGRRFTQRGGLKFHRTTRACEKTFECRVCKEQYKDKHSLTEHMSSHSGEIDFEKPFQCEVCEKRFSRPGYLKKHTMIHSGEKPYKCEVCGKYFARKGGLKFHRTTHTREKTLECHHCKNLYKTKYSLKDHLLTHMRDKDFENPYKCAVCAKDFTSPKYLKLHMMLHTGEKPYKCGECGREFVQSSSLKRHMATHTGENVFKCHECEKQYKDRYSLRDHLIIHVRERNLKILSSVQPVNLQNLSVVQHVSAKGFQLISTNEATYSNFT